MTQPRSALVSLDATPWYHVVSRCVRRAYLCGFDSHSGRNFEHRRGWIVERLRQLATVFAIDVAAYAVMSNHFHLVVRVDAERALGWDRDEVLRRWTQLFTGPELVQRYRAHPEGLCAAELARVDLWVTAYRERLMDLSWFMRVLNESIARQANAEDRFELDSHSDWLTSGTPIFWTRATQGHPLSASTHPRGTSCAYQAHPNRPRWYRQRLSLPLNVKRDKLSA